MRKFLVPLFLVSMLVGCHHQPPVPQPEPPKPIARGANYSIYDEAGAPVTDATCVLSFDHAPGEGPIPSLTGTGWRQELTYFIPPVHDGWGADLNCTSTNYQPLAVRFEPLPEGELTVSRMRSSVIVGDEHGWLRTQGRQFISEDTGQAWRYKGYTAFKYLQKFCNGEDIGPLLDDAIPVGARVFRTLLSFRGTLGSFTLIVDDPNRFDQCLRDYLTYMANRLVRVEAVVFADAQDIDQLRDNTNAQRGVLSRVSGVIAPYWNVLGELCNECPQNGVDPEEFTDPGTRVLWSRGSSFGNVAPPWLPWRYITYHESRNNEWMSKNECRVISDEHDVPCVSDEPIGFAERAIPGRRAGADANGDAGLAISDAGQNGGIFSQGAAGATCHTDAGIVGGLLGPVQKQMCSGFFVGLNFAPTHAQTGRYQRGDNCGNCDAVGVMPIEQIDSSEIRAYCRLLPDDSEWCAIARGSIRPRQGWRVVNEFWPGVVRLAR